MHTINLQLISSNNNTNYFKYWKAQLTYFSLFSKIFYVMSDLQSVNQELRVSKTFRKRFTSDSSILLSGLLAQCDNSWDFSISSKIFQAFLKIPSPTLNSFKILLNFRSFYASIFRQTVSFIYFLKLFFCLLLLKIVAFCLADTHTHTQTDTHRQRDIDEHEFQ